MAWLWMNIPLSVLMFGAVTGIPVWVVIKHPDVGPPAPGSKPEVCDVLDASAAGVIPDRLAA